MWEDVLDKDVRTAFADSVSSTSRELPEWTAGVEQT